MIAVLAHRMKSVLMWLLLGGGFISRLAAQAPEELAGVLDAAAVASGAGRNEIALTLLTEALSRARVNQRNKAIVSRLHVARAEAHFRLGDPEEAVASVQAAVRAADGKLEVSTATILADALLVMGDTAGAIEVLGPLEPALRDAYHARYLLGEAWMQEGRTEKALAVFLALQKATSSADVLHRLGVLYYEQREHEKALAAFREAIEKRPHDYYSRIYAARALLDLHRARDAARVLGDVRGLASTPELNYLLGLVAARSGDPRSACVHLRRALEESPDYTEAYFALAQALMKCKRRDEAKETLKRFRVLNKRDQEHLKQATRMEQAWHVRPDDVRRSFALAKHYFDAGQLEGAERYAWKALQVDSTSTRARLLLARALAGQGLFRESAVHYRKILTREPDHAAARSELEGLIRKHARRRS